MFTKQEIKDRWAVKQAAGAKADIHLALEIANASLFDKTNWDGSPYITHPLTAAFNNTQSNTKQIIGILHDVVEDTDWTLQDLRDVGFWDEVIDGIDGVTARDGEPYFDFLVRCGRSGTFSIDVKLKDLDHNTKKNRTKDVGIHERGFWKEKAYNISYFYLVAIKKGQIEPGTPMLDFIKSEPEYTKDPHIVNNLMDMFSTETGRLDARSTPAPQMPRI